MRDGISHYFLFFWTNGIGHIFGAKKLMVLVIN